MTGGCAWPSRSVAVAVGVVALGGVAACKDAAPDSPPAGSAAASSEVPAVVVMDEPTMAVPHQESFRLLDAGRGTRATLRYELTPGTAAFTARTALTSRHLEAGQFSAPLALPVIRDGFAITTAADHPDRLALLALTGAAAASTADTTAYLARWRTQLEGRHLAVTLDDRGGFTAIAFDDDPTGARSAQATADLADRLLTAIVPLPVEPAGTGASWRVVTILRQGPAYAKQTATYTLIARGPVTWKLHVKLLRVGEQQPLNDPALPRGTTAELLALFRSLEGDVEVDPAHPLITHGSLAVESRMHVRILDAGQPATEQMFEDTGSVGFALCRPAAHPVAAPRATHQPLGPCPDGFAPTP